MTKTTKLNVCLATAEFAPLAKTGGLADVSAALSSFLHEEGHDVRVIMPFYSTLKRDGLNIEPVSGLQNLTINVGAWNIEYSIESTKLTGNPMPIYLLRCPALYDRDGLYSNASDEHLRFILLSRAAIEMCQHMRFSPDIFHCHDWHTALIPLYLKTIYRWDQLFATTRSVLTIHNIGYQGMFPTDILNDLNLGGNKDKLHQEDFEKGVINFLKTGLLYADLLTTVSPTYAHEIQGGEYGMGLDDILRSRSHALIGILNGVDYKEWNPETDQTIPANFSAQDISGKAVCKRELLKNMGLNGREEAPLMGIVSRLVGQKGFDLVEDVLPEVLSRRDLSVVILGSGESRYEDFFSTLQRHAPDRVSFYRGYNEKLAHWVEAGSDMFLMPSLYEPCGLNQMYSLKYGTIPIVRETGGLVDSVQPINAADGSGTGIRFERYDGTGLRWAIDTALDFYAHKPLWKKVMYNAMTMDFSWQRQGDQYVNIFRQLSNK
ncbi:MAG: glycogen synthase GlgA [Gammaproteobacteria bacterium]